MRIVKTVGTIKDLVEKKAKVIVLSHFDRVSKLEHIQSGKKTLKVSFDRAQELMPDYRFMFVGETDFEKVRGVIMSNKENADVFVLENTRYYDICEKTGEKIK